MKRIVFLLVFISLATAADGQWPYRLLAPSTTRPVYLTGEPIVLVLTNAGTLPITWGNQCEIQHDCFVYNSQMQLVFDGRELFCSAFYAPVTIGPGESASSVWLPSQPITPGRYYFSTTIPPQQTARFDVVDPPYTVRAAKALPDNSAVTLQARVVTYAAPEAFYVKEDDRSMGIRVEKAGHSLAVGMRADVSGVTATNASGERFIQADAALHNGDGSIVPLALSGTAVGGGDWKVTGTGGQLGVEGGHGLNNIGLLVRVAGKVTFIDPGGQFFTLWDGADVSDPDGHKGIRVSAPGLIPSGLRLWDFVTVTGVVSCARSGGNLYPLVLVRTAEDMAVHATTSLQLKSLLAVAEADIWSHIQDSRTSTTGPVSAHLSLQNADPDGSGARYDVRSHAFADSGILAGAASVDFALMPGYLLWCGANTSASVIYRLVAQGPSQSGYLRYAFHYDGDLSSSAGGTAQGYLDLYVPMAKNLSWWLGGEGDVITEPIPISFGQPFEVEFRQSLYAWLHPPYWPYSDSVSAAATVRFSGPEIFDADMTPLGQLTADPNR